MIHYSIIDLLYDYWLCIYIIYDTTVCTNPQHVLCTLVQSSVSTPPKRSGGPQRHKFRPQHCWLAALNTLDSTKHTPLPAMVPMTWAILRLSTSIQSGPRPGTPIRDGNLGVLDNSFVCEFEKLKVGTWELGVRTCRLSMGTWKLRSGPPVTALQTYELSCRIFDLNQGGTCTGLHVLAPIPRNIHTN